MDLDLSPATLDLILYAGDGEAIELLFVDASDVGVDLSDRVWSAQWRSNPRASSFIALEIDQTQASTGILTVHLRAAMTRAMAPNGCWDLQGIVPGGEPSTILAGAVTLVQDVTR